jgi:hypothetical protein
MKCVASKDAMDRWRTSTTTTTSHKCTGHRKAVKCYAPTREGPGGDGRRRGGRRSAKSLKAYEPEGMPPADARIMVGLWLPSETAAMLAVPGGEAPEQLHLTMCYVGRVGEIGTNAIERLKGVCRDVADELPAAPGQGRRHGPVQCLGHVGWPRRDLRLRRPARPRGVPPAARELPGGRRRRLQEDARVHPAHHALVRRAGRREPGQRGSRRCRSCSTGSAWS